MSLTPSGQFVHVATRLVMPRMRPWLVIPWERPRPPDRLPHPRPNSPRVSSTSCRIGTPARRPKHTTAGPGRPPGTRRPPRTRYGAHLLAPLAGPVGTLDRWRRICHVASVAMSVCAAHDNVMMRKGERAIPLRGTRCPRRRCGRGLPRPLPMRRRGRSRRHAHERRPRRRGRRHGAADRLRAPSGRGVALGSVRHPATLAVARRGRPSRRPRRRLRAGVGRRGPAAPTAPSTVSSTSPIPRSSWRRVHGERAVPGVGGLARRRPSDRADRTVDAS